MSVVYEVTAVVRYELAPDFEKYMRGRHIPDVLATGCFTGAEFLSASGGRYSMRYTAADLAALEGYLESESPRLRADFAARFPEGVTAEREVWTTVETF